MTSSQGMKQLLKFFDRPPTFPPRAKINYEIYENAGLWTIKTKLVMGVLVPYQHTVSFRLGQEFQDKFIDGKTYATTATEENGVLVLTTPKLGAKQVLGIRRFTAKGKTLTVTSEAGAIKATTTHTKKRGRRAAEIAVAWEEFPQALNDAVDVIGQAVDVFFNASENEF